MTRERVCACKVDALVVGDEQQQQQQTTESKKNSERSEDVSKKARLALCPISVFSERGQTPLDETVFTRQTG